jgi:hypothetical protein
LQEAQLHGLSADLLDLRNSGDTAGPRDRVVGYGAYAFAEREQQHMPKPPANTDTPLLGASERQALLLLARGSIRHGLATGKALPVDLDAQPSHCGHGIPASSPCTSRSACAGASAIWRQSSRWRSTSPRTPSPPPFATRASRR